MVATLNFFRGAAGEERAWAVEIIPHKSDGGVMLNRMAVWMVVVMMSIPLLLPDDV